MPPTTNITRTFIYLVIRQYPSDLMTFRTRTRETVQVAFRKISNSGVSIAFTNANQKESRSLLKQNGLRAMTYQEALVKIDQNPELKERLKGKWFYLAEKGTELPGLYHFNNKGELTQEKGNMENTVVRVWTGNRPLSLLVRTDDDARDLGKRYYLSASVPSDVASVVVGVRDAHEVGTPQKEAVTARSELLEGAQKELEALSKRGTTTEEITFLTRLARGE